MREMMKMSVVCVLAILVCVGCTKKAKVNLDGLDQNPAGTVQDGDNSTTGSGGFGGGFDSANNPFVVPVANDGGNGGLSALDPNGANGIGGNGTWSDVNAALAGSDAENFVKNGQYFAQKVYFDFNRSEVRPSERPKLEALANHLQSNPTFGVVIEGHCDERGSDEYNRSLSERRSLAVKDYLASLGVNAARMRTVSYGEDRPDVPNARTEQEHQLNRRAQFLVGVMR
ncbi:MAG: OmpA family protein [Victivallales bacterium]|nr:OmpA family protein [Victivallales bacterium]